MQAAAVSGPFCCLYCWKQGAAWGPPWTKVETQPLMGLCWKPEKVRLGRGSTRGQERAALIAAAVWISPLLAF